MTFAEQAYVHALLAVPVIVGAFAFVVARVREWSE